ncbi:MAG TPA: hypothetical protein PKL28_03190 [Rhodocyclaceae bacterium]|jgi:hypothetical protein|nr:hypothetical protein [Rhodocyclaceae bacterium]HNE43526.1 hypothetical protein [Rhodocyclaceae bacterium]HNM20848.1 hypothetical protein [Rhodocyclaceae bacterium]HNM80032.1 hypothetical protein [Rhodocyclaceae bacterium]HNP03354.1 hypothetical protein [Rhodocyclaceae bacterium]
MPIALLLLMLLAPFRLFGATLMEFGASGDGVHDDTREIQAAIGQLPPGATLDGEGRAYRIRGSIRIFRSLTLRDATFIQGSPPDGTEGRVNDRTLFVRGESGKPVTVVFENLKVDRGVSATQGSPSDSAGIWIDGAVDSRLTNVEVTGNGRGSGVQLTDVVNMELRNLWIHDMTWAPCVAQTEGIPLEAIRTAWNSYAVISMKDCFNPASHRIRIQEPLTGMKILRSRAIRIIAPVIERLRARLADGRELAWQTDGITVGSDALDDSGRAIPSRISISGARISDVWEGIDLTGHPLSQVEISDAEVSDIHAFGIKMANGTTDVSIARSTVRRSGLAGFVVGGKNEAEGRYDSSRRIAFDDCLAVDTGANGYWEGQAAIAGFRVMRGAVQDPASIRIVRSRATDEQAVPTMTFGFLSACREAVEFREAVAKGYRDAEIHVVPVQCK